MKILVICTTPFSTNGITNVISNYDYYINRGEICMDYVLINKKHNSKTKKLKGNVFFLPMRNRNPFVYFFKLYKLMKKGKYSLVHVHGNSSTMLVEILAAFAAGVPNRIAHAHSTYCTHEKVNKILAPVFRKLVTYGIACSRDAGQWLFGNKTPFFISKNGIDIDRFSFNIETRKKYRKELGWEDSFVIGNVGYLGYPKNQSFLIDIFNEIQKKNINAKLILVGEGEDFSELQKKVNELNLKTKVEFLGQRNDVNMLLQAMDFFVVPSFFEGFSISILEAEISGLKIICSDTIPREVNVTGNVIYQSLNTGPQSWAQVITMQKDYQRNDQSELMYKQGLSVEQTALEIKKLYMVLIKRNGVRKCIR